MREERGPTTDELPKSVCVCMYVCMYVYMYVHTYIHTYIQYAVVGNTYMSPCLHLGTFCARTCHLRKLKGSAVERTSNRGSRAEHWYTERLLFVRPLPQWLPQYVVSTFWRCGLPASLTASVAFDIPRNPLPRAN
jgi:hypothetical protein